MSGRLISVLRTLVFPAFLCTGHGCVSVEPFQALPSTIPLDAELERLSYIGEATGKACRSSIGYIIPVERDGSIFEAKRAALLDVSRRYQRQAIALIDVSVDIETISYFIFYERACTWVRGKALGPRPSGQPDRSKEPELPRHTEKPTAAGVSWEEHITSARADVQAHVEREFLAVKQPAILQCLELDGVSGGVSVKIRVSKRGIPQSLVFVETLATTTKVCIRDVLKDVHYSEAQEDYEIAHTFR